MSLQTNRKFKKNNLLFHRGFRKGFNAQQSYRHDRKEKAERSNELDKSGYFDVQLTDQLKAFDCLPLDLIITKLEAHGFKMMLLV